MTTGFSGKKLIIASAILNVMLGAVFARNVVDSKTDSFKMTFVEKANGEILMDGKLDEADWGSAVPLTDFGPATAGIDTRWEIPRTEVRYLWDDKYLYVGVKCWETLPENMDTFNKRRADKRVSFIWRDSIELHLDGNNDRHTKFQIWLNPTDEKESHWHYDFGWGILVDSNYGLNSDWEKCYSVDKDCWTIEARFAMAHYEIQPRVGYIFGMEPVRFRFDKLMYPKEGSGLPHELVRRTQYLGWATQGRNHHRPEFYGKCILVEKTPANPVDGLKLAYPDLNERTIFLETPAEFVVVDKGNVSRLSFLDKGRELLAVSSVALKRYEDFVTKYPCPQIEGAASDSKFYGDIGGRISKSVDAFRAAESNLASSTSIDAAMVTSLKEKTAQWTKDFDNAYWQAVKKLLLAEQKVRIPVKLNPGPDAPGMYDNEPERWFQPQNRGFHGYAWAKSLAAKPRRTLICVESYGAWDAWQLKNRLGIDADVYSQSTTAIGSDGDYFNEGLMKFAAKRQMLERMLKEGNYGDFVFLGTSLSAWPVDLQCWLYAKMMEGANVVTINGGDPITGMKKESELVLGNPAEFPAIERDMDLVRRGEEYGIKDILVKLPDAKVGTFGKGHALTYNPGKAGTWCATTCLTPSWLEKNDNCFMDELAMGASVRAVMEGLGLRGERKAVSCIQGGDKESVLVTSGPAWKGDVVWNVRDTMGNNLARQSRPVALPAGTNHVALALPALGAGTYSVEARLEQNGKLFDYATGFVTIRPSKPVVCGCGDATCGAVLTTPAILEAKYVSGRDYVNAGEKIACNIKVSSASAKDLKLRAEIRDVRNRIVKREVIPVEAATGKVNVVFDQSGLDHVYNQIDLYLETDRVLDKKSLDLYRRCGRRKDFMVFTESAPGGGQMPAMRQAAYEYYGVDVWQTDHMVPKSIWNGGDLAIRDRIPGSAPDKGGSLSNPWWRDHLTRRYAKHARTLFSKNGRFISLGDDSGAPSGFRDSEPDWYPAFREFYTEDMQRKGMNDLYIKVKPYGKDFLDSLSTTDLPVVLRALKVAYPTPEHAARHLGIEAATWNDITLAKLRDSNPVKSPEFMNYLFWLKDKYKTVAALNYAWQSDVKDFFDITPALADDLQIDGKYGSAIDRQTFLEDAFIQQGAAIAKGIRGVDYTIGYGFGASTLGNTFPDSIKYLNSVVPYAGSDQVELARSRKGTVCLGECIGVYGGKVVSKPVRERQVWHGLLTGCNFGWYWHGSYQVEGDGSINPGRAGYMFDSYREVMRGPAALLRRSKFDNTGIRVLVSRDSGRMGPIKKELSTHGQSYSTFVTIANDLGYQWDLATTEDVESGLLARENVKLLLLGYTQILTEKEAAAIREFVKNGGTVIADARIATFDEHGKYNAKPLLDDVFGVKHTQRDAVVKRVDLAFDPILSTTNSPLLALAPGLSTLNSQPSTFKGVLADASVRADGAKVLATADGVEAFFMNEFGKGKAYLLNVNLAAYPFLRGRGELCGTREVMADIFASGAGSAKFGCVDAEGNAVANIEYTRYTRGAIELLGVEKIGLGCEKLPMNAFVTLPEKKHIYDVRKQEYIGFTDRIPVVYEGLDCYLFALMPYVVENVTLDAPDSVTRGEALKLTADLHLTNFQTHVVRVEFLPPWGESIERFAPVEFKLLDTKNGKVETEFPIAFNEETGDWKLIVTDTVTGKSVEKTIVIKELP